MRIILSGRNSQAARRVFYAAGMLIICALVSCGGGKNDAAAAPPVNFPLSRVHIGYGVINVSYTHLMRQPEEGGASSGYLRRGSVVNIRERRIVKRAEQNEVWVLAEGSDSGWLREDVMDIFDSELKAKTASESMSQ